MAGAENGGRELTAIRDRLLERLRCPLRDAATSLVFGRGNPDAEVFIIGEAPGRNEDLQGEPFVGAAGRELDRLLRLAGLTIDDVYIANILKYRPPENRNPKPDEIARHTPYLLEQIRAVRPMAIVTLGNFATRFVLGGFSVDGMKRVAGISQLHGVAVPGSLGALAFRVVPMYHPAAILYRRRLQPVVEEDFRKLRDVIPMGSRVSPRLDE